MYKLATALCCAAGVAAQGINVTVLGQLAQAFQSAGFTQLATIAASITNTTSGGAALSAITNGSGNYTIFAPTDAAFNAPNVTLPEDPEVLGQILSYHIVPGFYANQSLFSSSPNNTILTTFLNASEQVSLQGGAYQVISARIDGDNIRINNQDDIEVTNITSVDRFSILAIDGILSPPPDLASAAKNNNLTLFLQVLQQAGITDLVGGAKGITIFAPSDSAIQTALASLGAQATNKTLISTILQNHVINGTTVYSTQLDEANRTSAAGQALNFVFTNTTLRVFSGADASISANVTRRDVLAKNGVLHVIDAVLANPTRDDAAASSAYESATNAATDAASATPTPSGDTPVGGTPPGSAPHLVQQWTVVCGAALTAVLLGAVSL